MESPAVPRKLWEHPDPKSTLVWRFMQDLNNKHNLDLRVRLPCFFYTQVPTCSMLSPPTPTLAYIHTHLPAYLCSTCLQT
ncbi:hypothetical protein B0T26DRAFT_697133 [Lasiosphaeria miniovina]|uniref:Uncharacterized protein n=1 Tax=Lasiosphaeria miniovina TaxID=1954250 RepID=A0AA40B6G3_9PEZI|nr:uncharacterized protein B0T26DRAFT_697133 [Lasiosphaeria miniovina]KAK0728183.1 hypothetical protein B0T26DRAFT_697133 [Lasiosphaeria miniovina]